MPARRVAVLAWLAAALAWWLRPAADSRDPVAALLAPAPTVAAHPPATATVQPAAVAVLPPRPPDAWDLCGLGRMPLPPGTAFADLPPALGRNAYVEARSRTLAALLAGPPRARAAGLLLQPLAWPDGTRLTANAAELAQLALANGDAVALGWADSRCTQDQDPQACHLAVVRAAVQAEPDNAARWARLAQVEPQQAAQALQRMAQATQWHSHDGALTAQLLAAVPADVPGYLRLALAIEARGVEAAFAAPYPRLPSCAGSDTCSRVAAAMVDGGDDLPALHVGLRLGERAGWPAERVAAGRAELAALQAAAPRLDTQQPLSCASTEPLLRHLAELGRAGERQTLRRRLGP